MFIYSIGRTQDSKSKGIIGIFLIVSVTISCATGWINNVLCARNQLLYDNTGAVHADNLGGGGGGSLASSSVNFRSVGLHRAMPAAFSTYIVDTASLWHGFFFWGATLLSTGVAGVFFDWLLFLLDFFPWTEALRLRLLLLWLRQSIHATAASTLIGATDGSWILFDRLCFTRGDGGLRSDPPPKYVLVSLAEGLNLIGDLTLTVGLVCVRGV